MRTLTILLLGGAIFAQTPASAPTFEVVSIKPATETLMSLIRSRVKPSEIDDAHMILRTISLLGLIQMAMNLPEDQIVAPPWANEVNFDVAAKIPEGYSQKQIPQMLESMLGDRFQMKFHHEERVRPVYLLNAGKGAPKIKPTAGGEVNSCNGGRGGHHTCQNLTMAQFAEFLSMGRRMAATVPVGGTNVWLDRPVIDKTGLTGAYDFSLDFGRVGMGDRGTAADDPNSLVPLSEAVKDLGFVLEAAKAPYDVVVVDHVERTPTGN